MSGIINIHPEFRLWLLTTGFVLAGLVVGMLHFRLLYRQTNMLLQGTPAWRCLLLHCARFALTAAALFGAARTGMLPLLGCLAGFLLARKLQMNEAQSGHPQGDR